MTDRQGTLTIAAITLMFASAGDLLATKPCPPSPCHAHSGEFDRTKCERLAAWVAVGTISRVAHHREGPPLLKNFAEFTFRVERWEKGKGKMGHEFRFRVGWCDNQQQLPKATSGLFRFFGTTSSSGNQSRYLFFERLDARAP